MTRYPITRDLAYGWKGSTLTDNDSITVTRLLHVHSFYYKQINDNI